MSGLDELQDDVHRCCYHAGENIGDSLCLEEIEDDECPVHLQGILHFREYILHWQVVNALKS